ncbi:ankyrin repeat protein [Megavirus baoshan]|uniref:Ankyrin repeat protein n=1 Tax=Megavirus baoshan TaxID=2496520 RepID=A0A3Q8U8E0_9VIRU|nr:ankyrin repeat protein [Megavirus baoshan]AZL89684.1 ankyrin repeat protein [Megavirus baoshan]
MDTLRLKYNFKLPESFFKDINPKIRNVLSTCLHNLVYKKTNKYYITEDDDEDGAVNIYYIDDFNSKEMYYLLYESIIDHRTELVCELLNIYRNINIFDFNNLLLNMACERAQYPVISKLISAGVDVTFNNNIAIKLVSLSFTNHYIEQMNVIMTLELLLNNGADLHVDNDFILCYASDNIFIFKYLLQLEHKYDITSRDNFCLQRCVHNYFNNINYKDALSSIMESEEKVLVDINGNEFIVSDLIKILLDLGANVNCCDGYIFNEVVLYDYKYLIELFIEYRADLNLITSDSLSTIINEGDYNKIKLLRDNGLDFSKLNNEPVKNLKKINTANLLLETGLKLEKIFELI